MHVIELAVDLLSYLIVQLTKLIIFYNSRYWY